MSRDRLSELAQRDQPQVGGARQHDDDSCSRPNDEAFDRDVEYRDRGAVSEPRTLCDERGVQSGSTEGIGSYIDEINSGLADFALEEIFVTDQTPDPLDDLRATLAAQRAYLEEHGLLYDAPGVEPDQLAWAIREIEILRDQTVPPSDSDDLEDAFARHRTASPGPWSRDKDVILDAYGQPVALTGFSAFPARDPQAWHLKDAEFVAHAWEDIGKLLAEVRRLAAARKDDQVEVAAEDDHGANGGT